MSITQLTRSAVYGQNGMVCSNSPLAAAAGLRVLQEGGNAFDARPGRRRRGVRHPGARLRPGRRLLHPGLRRQERPGHQRQQQRGRRRGARKPSTIAARAWP